MSNDPPIQKTMTTDSRVDDALYAFLREKSAQMGECFTHEMFEQLRLDDPTAYDDELIQMKCAIAAYEAAKSADQPVELSCIGKQPILGEILQFTVNGDHIKDFSYSQSMTVGVEELMRSPKRESQPDELSVAPLGAEEMERMVGVMVHAIFDSQSHYIADLKDCEIASKAALTALELAGYRITHFKETKLGSIGL